MSICKSLSSSSSKNHKDNLFPSGSSRTPSLSSSENVNKQINIHNFEQIQPPNIDHELNVALSIVQQGSFITGDNVFDHLSDMIRLVVKERPENIVDYFEELSFNMREQKLKLPENFPWSYFEPIDVERAKSFMKLMNLPDEINNNEYDVCKENPPGYARKLAKMIQTPTHPIENLQRKLSLNENIQRLHLYWALCGFNISSDEVYRLSYALQKIQFNQNIKHARFWGIIYGLKKSYYIVEAQLTQSEIDKRFDKMRAEVMETISDFQEKKSQSLSKEQDWNLIPGVQWQNASVEDLEKMKCPCEPVPNPKTNVMFNIPPEPIGTGLNRKTYFVVCSLNDEWIELPIVDPRQIQISRQIKKLLTGDLNADVVSYPIFPGNEKNYLRSIIARITAGTYVAPNNYYRRLTKKEIMEAYGEATKEEDEDINESDGEEEEEDLDNDALIIENENYKPCSKNLKFPTFWVHVRPSILQQGRIAYFDEKKALEALENGSYLNVRSEEQLIEEADIDEGEDVYEADDGTLHEYSPSLFTACHLDKNDENVKSWSVRNSSTHSKINQLTIMRSNLWPGAYSFTFEDYSDSIYFGWGLKYSARNMSIAQVPPIQDENMTKGLSEVTDPTVKQEQAWRLYHERKPVEEIHEEDIEEEESC